MRSFVTGANGGEVNRHAAARLNAHYYTVIPFNFYYLIIGPRSTRSSNRRILRLIYV